MFPALVCGNAVIIKPAEDVPHSVTLLVETLLEAGLPKQVIQLVNGQGSRVGRSIVDHPDVPVISFTGSTSVGSAIGETCGRMHKRLSLEMGGKNAQIVMDDADHELAIDGVLWGAFGTTGQRCTATSRLLLHDKIHDEFLEKLEARVKRLRLGSGLDKDTDVGPLINQPALEKVAEYVEIARAEGDEVVTGGRRAGGPGLEHGHFYEPTILRGVRPGSRLACEEVFGPVLSVIRFGDLDEAIRINNEVEYGLSSNSTTGSRTSTRRPSAPKPTCLSAASRRPATATVRAGGRSTTSTAKPRSATSTSREGCREPRSTPTTAEGRPPIDNP
jgi:aldehyde dehydrogenase (NAD+)